MSKAIAHTSRHHGHPNHDLVDHLRSVARLASGFASPFRLAVCGEAAGRWHDLGKFKAEFQKKLHAEMHGDQSGRVDHSIAGALYALKHGGQMGNLLAYVIAGHHSGLPDWYRTETPSLLERMKTRATMGDLQLALTDEVPEDILAIPKFEDLGQRSPSMATRMLFSSLIDADRVDTGRYYNPTSGSLIINPIPMSILAERLAVYQNQQAKDRRDLGTDLTPINVLRQGVLQDCIRAAQWNPGFFSLSGPTGLGKTLSGLRFALDHATLHKMDRVFYVAPTISIIEQNAEVFRRAVGHDAVLEHHSNMGSDVDDMAEMRRQAQTENWNASLIVTTAVRFFETLFSAKTNNARRLHRVANSVVILDEGHTIPAPYLQPIMEALDELMNHYGVTVVISSATQPALDPRGMGPKRFTGLCGPVGRREIVTDPERLRGATRRVKVHLPDDLSTPSNLRDIALKIASHRSVLGIVGTRRQAYDLCKEMPRGTLHLSALMCPEHRLSVIRKAKAKLAESAIIRLISTQIIEAGVDISFPDLYRALAGLDSLAQSAGRCNREGLLQELGNFHIFVPPSIAPDLIMAAQITKGLLMACRDGDYFSAAMFEKFFNKLYWSRGKEGLDEKGICDLLHGHILDYRYNISFRTASDRFRLIEDESETVVVPWGSEGKEIIRALKTTDPSDLEWRNLIRAAQRFSVGISARDATKLASSKLIHRTTSSIWHAVPEAYSGVYGLKIYE